MPESRYLPVVPRVTRLPPTQGIADPQVRAFLLALEAQMNERSGLLGDTGARFITKSEFASLANDAILQAFSPGTVAGTISNDEARGAALKINKIIENLAESIRQSLVFQKLELHLSEQELNQIRRNIDDAFDGARAGISTEIVTREEQTLALASAINNVWAQIGGVSAVIDDGALAAASPSAATATKWNAVVASVTDPNTGAVNSASIKQELVSYANNANSTFNSVYSVRAQVSVGGQTVVGGFGLSASTSGGGITGPAGQGATIDFGVRADKFFIAATSSTPNAATQIAAGSDAPFMVLTTPQIVNGVTYPVGVYIKKAVIGEATIGSAQIADASIINAKIGTAAIGTANIAGAAITTALIATAAITNAKIGNAEVGTLTIAGNAVTIPVSAYSGGSISCTAGSNTSVQTASINSSGAPVAIWASVNSQPVGGFVTAQIYRDGSAVGPLITSSITETLNLMYVDIPGGGLHTFDLVIFNSTGSNASGRMLALLETKR